jgi:hypothetical protein
MLLEKMDDVSDVLSRCLTNEGDVLCESRLDPAFFDLRTRIAGELFQKVMNYQTRLAIVIADPARYGERFRELAYEHRNHAHIRFFNTTAQALQWVEERRRNSQPH